MGFCRSTWPPILRANASPASTTCSSPSPRLRPCCPCCPKDIRRHLLAGAGVPSLPRRHSHPPLPPQVCPRPFSHPRTVIAVLRCNAAIVIWLWIPTQHSLLSSAQRYLHCPADTPPSIIWNVSWRSKISVTRQRPLCCPASQGRVNKSLHLSIIAIFNCR